MNRVRFLCISLCLTTTFSVSQANPVSLSNQNMGVVPPISASQSDPKAQAKILDNYGKLPLAFEANHGQTDARVKFLSRTGAYTLFLTGDEAVLALSGKKMDTKAKTNRRAPTLEPVAAPKAGDVLRMKLRNANPTTKVSGIDALPGTSNYFIGNDPAKWRTGVPTYTKVKYEGIYSGIDLVYYGNQRQLEYDFIVAPGANPRRIQFDVGGAKRIRQDGNGDLVLKMRDGEIRWHKPVVYQERNGTREEIAARYAITTNRVGFELAKYDASRTLYIDPLIYSTYLGGSYWDQGYGIAVDSAGNAYVTGSTLSINFPTTPGAFQTTLDFRSLVFVTKFNPTGSALDYSTYLGGSNNGNYGYGIAVDSAGSAYVTGYTCSTNFPVTPGAFQMNGGYSAFVTKFNPTGTALIYSTYLSGNWEDQGNGIAVDSAGNAYVTGVAYGGFPTTPGAFQTTFGGGYSDAFVTKFNSTGSALVYSTYLGASGADASTGIAVDGAGNAYVTGSTGSIDFPVTPGAFQTTCCGTFVTKINLTGTALVYSTYLDGSYAQGIAADSTGNAYVTGQAGPNFPTTPGAFQTICGNRSSCENAFVTKFNPTGSALDYSTYLGGSNNGNYGYGIAVDSAGSAYVTGYTDSPDFPVTSGAFQPVYGGTCSTFGCNSNAFLTKINPSGSALVYSTFLGGRAGDGSNGIALDSSGYAYVTGLTDSSDFPTMNPLQPTYGGTGDALVAKISAEPSDVTLLPLHLDFGTQPMGIASSPQVSTLTNVGNSTLTITSISVIGANGGDFAQTNNCATTVWAGTSCSITVTFAPAATGTRSAAVYIADSAADSPQSFSLTGFGLQDTVTKLISSTNPSLLGKGLTFSATVSSPSGGTPTGYVAFREGATTLASKALKGGMVKFTTKDLPLGLNVITAFYGGGSYGFSISAPVNEYVVDAITTTVVTSAPNPSTYGGTVNFTAVVTSKLGAPPDGEIVTFTEGSTVLGTAELSGGSARFTTSTMAAGIDSIVALYGGDSDFGGSTSKVVKQVVETPTPYGVVSPTTLNFGQVQLGQTSAPLLVSLENTGESELTVSNISISGDFALPTNQCANGVKPGTHCNVYVTYTPRAVESDTGTLTFTDNASNSPQTVSLTGTGIN